MRALDLSGHRFGRLVVYRRITGARSGRVTWECACDCGATANATTGDLRSGNTASCGCLRREVAAARVRTHGMTETPAYRAWTNMIIRTSRTSGPSWRTYGARGIGVCERWRTFEAFYADMGDPPPSYSLDRIDNDRGYEPGNCRWADDLTQGQNRRSVSALTFNGKTQNITAWSRDTGLSRNAIRVRLANGWPIERALTEPAHH